MKSLLLVADTREWLGQLQKVLGEAYTLFAAESQGDALEFLQGTKVDVVVAAFDRRAATIGRFFEQAKALQPQCVSLYLAPPLSPEGVGDATGAPQSDFWLRRPFSDGELHRTIEQAIEQQRRLEELAAHREQGRVERPAPPSQPAGDVSVARIGRILADFARAFHANFDLGRALNLFLDAVSALLRPSRLSILVANPATREFEVRAYRGLRPTVAERLRLRANEGLPRWLMTEGRISHRAEVESHLRTPPYLEIRREMQALQAVASIPLIAAGTLVGILNLGERVTGQLYTDDELELLFSLASQVAVDIQDINLYHELQYQKTFIENILTHMSSGVITIGVDEKVRTFNHRAAEILGTSVAEVLHENLRQLPSPLGDLLCDTLRHGIAYRQHEVLLAASKRPLEVSTYQIFDDQRHVSGSVMVCEDLTSQKQLSEERRRADQLDFLNKVVGRMAHEIKNPLVSIRTFVELLGDQYDDPEFRHQFYSIVRQDIQAIESITEKLLNLASKISYRFEYGDINTVIKNCISSLHVDSNYSSKYRQQEQHEKDQDGSIDQNIQVTYGENLPPVKFDREHFEKALTYLFVYLMQSAKNVGQLVLISQLGQSKHHMPCIHITITGRGCKLSTDDLQHLFDPFSTGQSTIVDVGPCVAQKIIEEHGGHLDVRQEDNGDTTFVIALPVS